MSKLLRSDWKIEKKGAVPLAVFHIADPKKKGWDDLLVDGHVKHVEHVEPTAVFDEAGLLARISMIEGGGRSAALEKAALFALQHMKQLGVKK